MRAKFATALILSGLLVSTPSWAKPLTSPWNGDWRLDATRSSAGAADGAADAYRFTIAGRTIRWEIPSIGEVVTGSTDGRPMVIRRHGVGDGTRLSVSAESRATLRYRLTNHGAYLGGGRMTLVDDGQAWVDVTWGPPGPPKAAQLVYVRRR